LGRAFIKIPKISSGRYIAGFGVKGGIGGRKKLQLYPTNLTYSPPVMWWRALGQMAGVGFVECVGLSGG